MINYKHEQKRLDKMDIDLDDFKETIDLALGERLLSLVPRLRTSLASFTHPTKIKDAKVQAISDIQKLGYDDIHNLACGMCVRIELTNDRKKEEKTDWHLQEQQRTKKAGF